MNFKDLASNLGLDEEDFDELVEVFTATSFSDIEKINSGLEDKNPAAVAQAAHSIKGASGNLGFKDISSLSKDIETAAKQGNINGLEENINIIIEKLKKIKSMAQSN
jgi:histidine phosphotransfer protein HptB